MTTSTPSFSPGLEGVPIAESSLSLVEGQAGRLSYRAAVPSVGKFYCIVTA